MTKKSAKSPVDNTETDREGNYLIVSVNPKIYSLDIVYYAAYVLMDRAYITLGGDPEKEILVELRPQSNTDLETLGREFNNELLNYAVYMKQSAKNQRLREAILQRVLLTNLATPEGETGNSVNDARGSTKTRGKKHGKKIKKGQGG